MITKKKVPQKHLLLFILHETRQTLKRLKKQNIILRRHLKAGRHFKKTFHLTVHPSVLTQEMNLQLTSTLKRVLLAVILLLLLKGNVQRINLVKISTVNLHSMCNKQVTQKWRECQVPYVVIFIMTHSNKQQRFLEAIMYSNTSTRNLSDHPLLDQQRHRLLETCSHWFLSIALIQLFHSTS